MARQQQDKPTRPRRKRQVNRKRRDWVQLLNLIVNAIRLLLDLLPFL